jgi:hypothetical protein
LTWGFERSSSMPMSSTIITDGFSPKSFCMVGDRSDGDGKKMNSKRTDSEKEKDTDMDLYTSTRSMRAYSFRRILVLI